MNICAKFGDVEAGYRFGKFALSLLDSFKAKDIFPRVNMMVYSCINFYIEPLQACLEQIFKGRDIGLAICDIEFALINRTAYTMMAMRCGQNLDTLSKGKWCLICCQKVSNGILCCM